MAQVACSNLNQNEEGEYEDPITLDVIPKGRIVHLPFAQVVFCYDALELLRYIRSEQDSRRAPTLPDNRNPLTPNGIAEVQRVARLSFPQLYKVVGLPRNRELTFTTEAEARNYVQGRQGLRYWSYADIDDPLLEDLLYPNGLEETPTVPYPGPYIDEQAIERRASFERERNERERVRREQEAREQEGEVLLPGGDFEQQMEREDRDINLQEAFEARMRAAGEEFDEEQLRQPDEIELGNTLAREVRPGEWRCGIKSDIYRERQIRNNFRPIGERQPVHPEHYCSHKQISDLRHAGYEANDPSEWGLGQNEEVEGETLWFFPDNGSPSCANDGSDQTNDPCRPDLVEEVAAQRSRRYLGFMNGHEIEYRFDRPSEHFYCQDLDDPNGVEYQCDDQIRHEFGWGSALDDPEVIFRRTSLRGPIQCVTKQEWHEARRTGQPLPWAECSEQQRQYLRELPDDEYFRNLESGRLADEAEQNEFESRVARLVENVYRLQGPPVGESSEIFDDMRRYFQARVPVLPPYDDEVADAIREAAFMFVRSMGQEPRDYDPTTNAIREYLANKWEELYEGYEISRQAARERDEEDDE